MRAISLVAVFCKGVAALKLDEEIIDYIANAFDLQVRSPPIGRSPSVGGLAPSPMMQPGGAQQMQPQGAVGQDQQPYR